MNSVGLVGSNGSERERGVGVWTSHKGLFTPTPRTLLSPLFSSSALSLSPFRTVFVHLTK